MEIAAEMELDKPRESPKDDEARAEEGVDSVDQYKASTTLENTRDEKEEVEAKKTPFPATLNSSSGSGCLTKGYTRSRGSRHAFELQNPFVRDTLRFNMGGSGSDREGADLFGGLEHDAGSLSGELDSDEINYGSPQRYLDLHAAKVGIPYHYFRC